VARAAGDGIFLSVPNRRLFPPENHGGFDWVARLRTGTVLDEGEESGAERALAVAGHAAAVTRLLRRGQRGRLASA
jgi:hypothetical protein